MATIRLKPLDPVPDVAYSVTQDDVNRFPRLGEVLAAYDNPSCCADARRADDTLFFDVPEGEGLELTTYLLERYEALGPPSERSYEVALQYEAQYYQWSLLVS